MTVSYTHLDVYKRQGYNPGYSFHGRIMALAQIEGMMAVINEESKLKS